jgi:hypothetical protein
MPYICCIALHCIALHCTALYCIALHYIALRASSATHHTRTHAAYMCVYCAWFTGPRAVHHYLQLALPIDRDPHISTYGRPSSSHPSYPSNTCCCSLRLELSNATNPWRHASHFAFYRIRSLLLLVGTYVTTGKPVFAVRQNLCRALEKNARQRFCLLWVFSMAHDKVRFPLFHISNK